MKLADLFKKVKEFGWERSKGGEHAFCIEKDGRRISITNHPSKDIPTGTLKKIERLTGVKLI